jgi:Cytochrome C biogenesis protein transmembrane region
MKDNNDPIKTTKIRPYLSKWSIWLSLGTFTTITIILTNNADLLQPLESIISQSENHYEKWGVRQSMAYALGYTAVIFATSLFAGLMKFTRQILVNSETVMRWGGLALILMGGYYVVSGVLWFV